MDISRGLNQTVIWQQVTSADTRDDRTYATGVSINARTVQKLKDLIAKDGEVTTATNQVTLAPNSSVSVGDLLDGREVVAISSMVTFRGSTIGYVALTR